MNSPGLAHFVSLMDADIEHYEARPTSILPWRRRNADEDLAMMRAWRRYALLLDGGLTESAPTDAEGTSA